MTELVYTYVCKNAFLLKHAVDDKIKSLSVDPFNIMRYDLSESNLDDVLEDLLTISFFSEQKVIIIDHFSEIISMEQSMIDDMIKYLTNPNPDVILIIMLDEMLSGQHDIHKAIQNYTYIEKVKDLDKDAYTQFVFDKFKNKGYTITSDAITELLVRINDDFNLLEREAEKLMLYHIDTKSISLQDVLILTSKNLEENIYDLTNALVQKNHAKLIDIYTDLMMRNEDPIRIMNNIANRLRELIHTKLLLDQGLSQTQIAEHFNIKSGRAYYLVKDAQSNTLKILEKHLEQLSKLDYEIKSGLKDKKLGLELYLLGV
jgi:DNA polymerase III subunit delta